MLVVKNCLDSYRSFHFLFPDMSRYHWDNIPTEVLASKACTSSVHPAVAAQALVTARGADLACYSILLSAHSC